LDLEKNTEYWRPGVPLVHRLVFHYGLDSERMVRDFRAGRLSLVGDLSPKEIETLRRDPKLAPGYAESPRLSTTFLALNSLSGPFSQLDRRRDFVAAFDVAPLLRDTIGDGLILAHGLLPPGLLGYEAPRSVAPVRRAETRLWQGVELKVALHSIYRGPYATLWQEIRRFLVELGITVRLVDESLNEVVRRVRRGEPADVDLMACRWIADYPDADAFAMGLVHSREGLLAGLVHSPALDERIEKSRQETDPALRHALYREIEEELARERLLIPLFHEQTYRFSHPTLRGFKIGFSLPEVRYEELFMAR
jgi:ABC-type oligopeptide transport system substrate-binding subunit